MNLFSGKILGLTVAITISVAAHASHGPVNIRALSNIGGAPFPPLQITKLIIMPDRAGHHDWVDAINSATHSIHMSMYHLTDQEVIDALSAKANLEVRVIVDRSSDKHGFSQALVALKSSGVQVRPASAAFSLMHTKEMVIDDQVAFVTAINMTNTGTNTRDFGIITSDRSVIEEMDSVFETDWTNAESGAGDTPQLSQPNLAWSPVNSEEKLIQLIDSSTSSLILQAESLSFPGVLTALENAAQRGVNVQVMAPMCDSGNAFYDYPALTELKGKSVNVRVMPYPASFDQPYMHSKMIVADGANVYIGSINYSANSIQRSRELGILFNDASVGSEITQEFDKDWARSVVPEDNPSPSVCHQTKKK